MVRVSILSKKSVAKAFLIPLAILTVLKLAFAVGPATNEREAWMVDATVEWGEGPAPERLRGKAIVERGGPEWVTIADNRDGIVVLGRRLADTEPLQLEIAVMDKRKSPAQKLGEAQITVPVGESAEAADKGTGLKLSVLVNKIRFRLDD